MGNLFAGKSMPDEAAERTHDALQKVERADINELLSRDVEVLVAEFAEPFEPASVRWDDATMTEPEQFNWQDRDIFDGRVTRQGLKSTAKIPVDGDALLLTYRSHSGAPASSTITGIVKPGSLELIWRGEINPENAPAAIVDWFARHRAHVERFLVYNNGDTAGMNEQMLDTVRREIERRKTQELQRRQIAASLPFPIERKPGASVPVRAARKQVRIQARPAPAPFTPEPELEHALYVSHRV